MQLSVTRPAAHAVPSGLLSGVDVASCSPVHLLSTGRCRLQLFFRHQYGTTIVISYSYIALHCVVYSNQNKLSLNYANTMNAKLNTLTIEKYFMRSIQYFIKLNMVMNYIRNIISAEMD